MEDKDKLKKCPFCGCRADLSADEKIGMWVVQCFVCGCRLPGEFGKEQAIKKWNRRVGNG